MNRLVADLSQKSAGLSDLLSNYSTAPIRGIDASKFAPPIVPENGELEELKEMEKRGRLGEAHMALRWVMG
jgi:pre-mRNA-splicing factor SPF27